MRRQAAGSGGLRGTGLLRSQYRTNAILDLSSAGVLYRLWGHRGRLQDRDRVALQTIGHVLGRAWRGKYIGFALHPCQPPAGSILERATQRSRCRERLPRPGGVAEEFCRAPPAGERLSTGLTGKKLVCLRPNWSPYSARRRSLAPAKQTPNPSMKQGQWWIAK